MPLYLVRHGDAYSEAADSVPASSVNFVGRILGDATVLKQTKGASRIRIEITEA